MLCNDNVFFFCDVHGDCPQLPLSGTRNIQNAYTGKLSLESCKRIESDYGNNACYVAWLPVVRPVLTMSNGPPPQVQQSFVKTSTLFSLFSELYENKLKNLIPTSKLKFSFRRLSAQSLTTSL